MNNIQPKAIGISDLINASSKELQASVNSVHEADTTNEEPLYKFTENNADGTIVESLFVIINGEVHVVTIDKENEGNKANPLMTEASINDNAEYFNPDIIDSHKLIGNLTTNVTKDLKGVGTEVDVLVETPEQKHIKNESPLKKRRLHEMTEPLSDEIEEKRRIGAINAKKNREKNKAIMDHLNKELSKEKEKNKNLEYQLKNERNATKIALLEKKNSDLKYELLLGKYERLTENK